jgi:hypothetical protein
VNSADVAKKIADLSLPRIEDALRAAARAPNEPASVIFLEGTPQGRSDESILLLIGDGYLEVPISSILEVIDQQPTAGSTPGSLRLAVQVPAGMALLSHKAVAAHSVPRASSVDASDQAVGLLPFALAQPTQAPLFAADHASVEKLEMSRAARLGLASTYPGQHTGIKPKQTPTVTSKVCQVTSTGGTTDTVVDYVPDTVSDNTHDDIDA